jgi:hypothetical protein
MFLVMRSFLYLKNIYDAMMIKVLYEDVIDYDGKEIEN